jgi:hypothetical protein
MATKQIDTHSVEQQQKLILALLIQQSQVRQSKQLSTHPSQHNKLLRKIFEVTVIAVATWLNPEATIPIAMLKVCFLIWDYLRRDKDE